MNRIPRPRILSSCSNVDNFPITLLRRSGKFSVDAIYDESADESYGYPKGASKAIAQRTTQLRNAGGMLLPRRVSVNYYLRVM